MTALEDIKSSDVHPISERIIMNVTPKNAGRFKHLVFMTEIIGDCFLSVSSFFKMVKNSWSSFEHSKVQPYLVSQSTCILRRKDAFI